MRESENKIKLGNFIYILFTLLLFIFVSDIDGTEQASKDEVSPIRFD